MFRVRLKTRIRLMSASFGCLVITLACVAAVGCGGAGPRSAKQTTAAKRVSSDKTPKIIPSTSPKPPSSPRNKPAEEPIAATPPPGVPRPLPPPRAENNDGTLTDLVKQANAAESQLPIINETRTAAAGIRKLAGKHLTIYTDVPDAPAIAELPKVFDLAVPQWLAYFELDEKTAAEWMVVAYLMKDSERFVGTSLLPNNISVTPERGFQRGSEFWWYDQPSDFYRRELMLHEGTHAFMARHFGGLGPPWYAEGMAEYLGTHKWEGGKLTLGYNPRTKEEAPFWGRVKVLKDDFAASRGKLLAEVFEYGPQAHLKNEPYAWSWAAAMFLDNHPLSRKAFRKLKESSPDRSMDFSTKFVKDLDRDWPVISEDWQLFIASADYGYDVARAAVQRKGEVTALPAAGATITVAADRGWQSSGFAVEPGKTYKLTATGRYQVAKEPQPWPCEPGGITIRYHRGKPLGMLMAAIGDVKLDAHTVTPLAKPTAVGTLAELTPMFAGTLYLSINEAAGGLADNEGTLTVRIEQQ
jgi:hypothetical protein